MKPKDAHVAVVGGGCAGLSAAATLLEQGFNVTLFEASAQLGGRARTVFVKKNNVLHSLDNGQHIVLGAYHETLALLKKAGVDEEKAWLRVRLQIKLLKGNGQVAFFLKPARYLPSPLNILLGLITCQALCISERILAVKFLIHLKKNHFKITADIDLASYLQQQKQTTKLIDMLWEPLCLAALNTPIASASTQIFLNVLKDSFASNGFANKSRIRQKNNSDFLLPRLDLSHIIAKPLADYISKQGGTIQCNTMVNKLTVEGNGFGLTTQKGTQFFSHVVLATPALSAQKLMASIPHTQYNSQEKKPLDYQPIYTIYLQYPPEFTLPDVMTGLTGTLSQWVFDRGQLCNQNGLVGVIISAAGAHQLLDHNTLALTVAKEINGAFKNVPQPLWHQVIAEKRATFLCAPNLERPTHKTQQQGLYLAGDYTHATYPATIEGAVRSGIACAHLIAHDANVDG